MMLFIGFEAGETVAVIRLQACQALLCLSSNLSQMQLHDNTMHDMSATDRVMYEYILCVSTPPARSAPSKKITTLDTLFM